MGTTNPNDTFYTGQLTNISNNNTAFAIEDTAVTGNTGHDYDDIILQLQGATNNALSLSNIINPGTDWRNSTLGRQIVNFINSADTTPPQISAGLANDTGFNNTDKITLDPTITGSIIDASKIYSFRARFNNTTPGTYIDAIDLIKADGSFTFNRQQLETIYGASLPDGTHSLYLQAIDENGLISNTLNLSFTLDTKAPEISLKAPFAGVDHSPTARIIGSATDMSAGLNNNIQYNLDSQQNGQISLSKIGIFDSKITPTNLTNGTHNLTLQVSDKAGNITQTDVNFNVTNNFNIGPAENQGWGVNSEVFILLNEKGSLYTETTIPIELGQSQGTRKIQFQISPNFDTTSTTTLEDTFQVFLLDPTNANQILLGNSKNQALFSLTGNKPEYTAGLGNYNGSIVEIDLSSLSEKTNGLLLFKLLNNDTDTGTSIEIKNLTNTVDIEGISSPIFPERIEQVTAGPALDISNFSPSQNVEIILSEISLDTTTGLYKANLSVKNNTSSSISRNIAILFPTIPVGIELQNSSGISNNGIPYINLKNAIQAGGLAAGAISDSVEIVFTNPNFQLFPITANVLNGSANVAPDFPTIAPLTVTPGGHLEIPLTATDANGDTITFSLQSESVIPTGKISNNKLIFTPTLNEIGTYSFILIASDGDKQTQQTVTLNVIADPITTTRITSVVLSTNGTPLAGVPVELSRLSTLTTADGSFTLELPSSLVPTEPFNIEIPQGDQYFDPYN